MADGKNLISRIISTFTGSQANEQPELSSDTPVIEHKAMPLMKDEQKMTMRAELSDIGYNSSNYSSIFTMSFNGEKNYGSIGPATHYYLDYDQLRARSWQMYLESDVFGTIIGKYAKWVIGAGLNVQATPDIDVLISEGITIDKEKFSKAIESRFRVWAQSRISDYRSMRTLNQLGMTAFLNANIGGDVLVILRYKKGNITVQLIDGAHVRCISHVGNDRFSVALPNGNTVRNGIELSPTGEHVRYCVLQPDNTEYWVDCYNQATGMRMAYMVFGDEYRLDNYRGVPLMAKILEKIKVLDRYTDATLASAEEVSKLAIQILHDKDSTGENPLQHMMATMRSNGGTVERDLPIDVNGVVLQDKVAATTNKQAINMPQGAKAEPINASNAQINHREFSLTHIELMCAAVGIPHNVAMSIYNDSYTASMAAIGDWTKVILMERSNFTTDFYKPIYDLFLHINVLQNKITAPGYLQALAQDNHMAVEAYRVIRCTGPMPTHVDPNKSVTAARKRLGPMFDKVPLSTLEAEIEQIGGDNDDVLSQVADELRVAKSLGFEPDDTTNK